MICELGDIKHAVEAGFAYDMMLQAGNAVGEEIITGGVNAFIN
jgi:putative iron-regulated protein